MWLRKWWCMVATKTAGLRRAEMKCRGQKLTWMCCTVFQMKNNCIKSWAWQVTMTTSLPSSPKVHSSLLLVFLKYFDLERSSSLINEPVISSLLRISRELSQPSLTTLSKQLKSPVPKACIFRPESLPITTFYLTKVEKAWKKVG